MVSDACLLYKDVPSAADKMFISISWNMIRSAYDIRVSVGTITKSFGRFFASRLDAQSYRLIRSNEIVVEWIDQEEQAEAVWMHWRLLGAELIASANN